VLGLGAACLRRVPLDAEHRMDVSALAEAIAVDERAGVVPAIAVGQAASAQTGASDPLDRVADVCERHRVWLHVDGAFGAFLRLCERTAPLVAGLERGDSLAVDGHKWLNVPNGIGFALVRDAALHRQALAGSASYLTGLPGAGEDPHALGIESSRGWRGAAVWAAIRQLGRSGVGEIVTRCCDCAAHLAALVERSPRLELVAPAASCVVCFRYRPAGAPDGPALDELNRRIQVDVARGGDVFVGGAELGRGFCLRACIVSWRTHREDVEALVDAVEAAGVRLG
jgi:glutamate/tyrosine decarboxylase-like PLP-dependent enzyme